MIEKNQLQQIILSLNLLSSEKIELIEHKIVDKSLIIFLETNIKNKERLEILKQEIISQAKYDQDEIKIIFSSTKKFDEIAINKKAKIIFENIKNIILISSGKGGVGKSTCAFNIAQLLAKKGLKIGLLDADIHGPSINLLADTTSELETQDGFFIPIEKNNVQIISIGMLIPPEKSLVWRGPMVTKALHKLIKSSKWGALDYLIIDMPPGSGDIHLTMCENYQISGTIMVTTPQKLSISDVLRAIDMYEKLGIKIYGIIENMSYIETKQGERLYPFGKIDDCKKTFGYNLIAQIPLKDDSVAIQNSLETVINHI